MANEDQNPKQNPVNPNEDTPDTASDSPYNSPTNQDNTSRPSNDPPRASLQQEVNSAAMHEKSPSKFTGIVSSPSSKGKKRVASSGSTSGTIIKQRKKPEFDSPQRSPACYICSKQFDSWPAVFGHMRCHKDRPWRGAFPPPMWSNVDRDAVAEEAAAALVQAAKDAQLMMEDQSGATSSAAIVSSSRINVDLNEPQEDVGSSESASEKVCVAKFDLNMPPPEDDDDDVGGATV